MDGVNTPVEEHNSVDGVVSDGPVEMPVENENIVEGWDPTDMFEPRTKTRGVSQFADGPVSDFYQTFVNNRRQFDAAKTRYAKFLTRDAVDANDMFEPRSFTRVAVEAQVVDVQPPTPSFNSVPETFDSNEKTPQSDNSHSVLTPEVAMYCGAL